MDEYLSSFYYDPKRPGGFGGVDRLYDEVKKEGKFAISRKKIKEWLMKQDAYTLHKPMRRHIWQTCSPCKSLMMVTVNKHFQALMKEEDIELCNTYNEMKASIVERLIRNLKTKMWRYFTAKKTMRYVDMLPNLIYSYNHSVHHSIKTEPAEVTVENKKKVWHTLYDHEAIKNIKYKFKIDDQVRISKMKRTLEKGAYQICQKKSLL